MTKEEMLRSVSRICEYYEGLKQAIRIEDISAMARELLQSSVHILDAEGQRLACTEETDTCRLNDADAARRVALSLSNATSPRIDIARDGACPFNEGSCTFKERTHVILPLYFSSERIGTLICTRDGSDCDELYQSLCKILAMLCAMAVYNDKQNIREQKALRYAAASQAIASLSFTEKQAICAIIKSLPKAKDASDTPGGLLNASDISKQENITRSVIASALKKLESAGIINIKSLGMRGTHITVLNGNIYGILNI